MEKARTLASMVSQAGNGEYMVHGNTADAECVIAQSFGYQEATDGTVEPGWSNYALASYVLENFSYHMPKILQFEVGDAFEKFQGLSGQYYRIEKHREEGKYLDTREVLEQSAAIMEENQWRSAAVVAHRHHVPRVDAAARRLGIDTIVPNALPGTWDPESAQWWTRSPERWFSREVPTIGYYAVKGWLDLTKPRE